MGSFVTLPACPQEMIPEYAFIGRSNVGKSSLINYICDRKALAKVSVTPGKTQTLNYYLINKKWHLVDLPGYGFAKISRTMREKWQKMIENYADKREQLQYVFLLIDSRVPPQKLDMEFINFMGERSLPFAIVFTKADKRNSPEIQKNIDAFQSQLLESWEELPHIFVTTSERKKGKEDILNFITEANKTPVFKQKES